MMQEARLVSERTWEVEVSDQVAAQLLRDDHHVWRPIHTGDSAEIARLERQLTRSRVDLVDRTDRAISLAEGCFIKC